MGSALSTVGFRSAVQRFQLASSVELLTLPLPPPSRRDFAFARHGHVRDGPFRSKQRIRGHVSGRVLATRYRPMRYLSALCPVNRGPRLYHYPCQDRPAVILHQNRNDTFARQANHGFRIIVEQDRFLQMKMLQCSRHPHPEADRAVLKQIKPHETCSLFRSDLAGLRSVGAQDTPWQQFSVRKETRSFIASNRAE